MEENQKVEVSMVGGLNGMFNRMRYEVWKYATEHLDKSDRINFPFTEDNVYIVWSCKTLQNWKALISTSLPDGMYYECTFNGDKEELYFDAYKKFDHKVVKMISVDTINKAIIEPLKNATPLPENYTPEQGDVILFNQDDPSNR